MSLWKRVADSIQRTRGVFAGGLQQVFARRPALTEDFYSDLEDVLLGADVGLETTQRIIERLRDRASETGAEESADGRTLLAEVLTEVLSRGVAAPPPAPAPGEPRVVLVVGVNGVGKTTSIGKLAYRYQQEGLRPLVVASDTFRAAALEQLGIWADRSGADLIRSQPGADPAAVAFDGVQAARARGASVVLIDTAGRIQTNVNLMDELRKIRRVVAKAQPGAPHETLLVLDATVGQNALSQARLFTAAAGVTGILLAKLDGSARGGVILAIADTLKIPVRYVGIGEEIDALTDFSPDDFARALLEPLTAGG
jgi:fused signal recognition particle receptor